MSDTSDGTLSHTPGTTSGQSALFEVLTFLARNKIILVAFSLLGGVVAAAFTFVIPEIYTSTARILPPQQAQAASASGGLGGGIPVSSLAVKSPAEVYIGLLSSRSVADGLIHRFKLQEAFGASIMDDARAALAGMTRINIGRGGIIAIDVDDTNPARAAELANGYIEELDRLLQSVAITEAAQRRLYFEKQLKQARENLATAEVALKQTQEETGLIKLDEQGRAIIEMVANLRGQITAKEVQLSAMGASATQRNPDFIRTQRELDALRSERDKMLEKIGISAKGELLFAPGNVPEAGLEYVRRVREVKYAETVYDLLVRQYETARADEARHGGGVQVVDRAMPPERKSRPVRRPIVMLGTMTGFVIGLLFALVRDWRLRVAANPELSARLAALRSQLRFRSSDR